MAKVCVFLANGFEEIEALTVVDILRRAKQEVTTVSIGEKREVCGAHDIEVKADCCMHNMNFENIDMLVLPGGSGTKNLHASKELATLLQAFAAQGKKLAAICAAPGVLGRLGILEGKKATCYPGIEEQLLGATVTTNRVEVDGTIITSQGVGTSILFALELVASLENRNLADEIKMGIVYGHKQEEK